MSETNHDLLGCSLLLVLFDMVLLALLYGWGRVFPPYHEILSRIGGC